MTSPPSSLRAEAKPDRIPLESQGATVADETAPLRRRLVIAALAMIAVYSGGTLGYLVLGGGRWSLSDCAYMTVISLTTVGYSEVLPGLDTVPYARLFTSMLLLSGAGIALYAISVLTTFLVEGEFLQIRRRRKMRKAIDRLHEHIIVCGAGKTGAHLIDELLQSGSQFVVIEKSDEIVHRLEEAGDIHYIQGDAIDDAVLEAAGIRRAYGVVAALAEDRDNLYVVVTARGMNPKLRIVSKAIDPRAANKLRVAGADSVVRVNQIGGVRLASEMIRPEVVTFLDNLVRERDKRLRFEEVTVPAGSSLIGKPLADADIRKERNLLIVAATERGDADYTYSPGPSYVLREGMTLIVLGETESVARFRKSIGD